jgi:hypothetical protein
MSKGLGKLQRAILDSLDIAKNSTEYYKGRGHLNMPFIKAYGYNIVIADGVYDLRETIKYLAKKNQKTFCRGAYVKEIYQVSFSRAVRTLVKRNLLKPLWLVPLKEVEEKIVETYGNFYNMRVMKLKDRWYLIFRERQIRFVEKTFTCFGKNT